MSEEALERTSLIATARLELVPATLALLDAELASASHLALLLGADVPPGWPPGEYDRGAVEYFRSCLLEKPEAVGWYGWYAVLEQDGLRPRTVVGAGGFLGPPDGGGVVEVGYSIVPAFEGRGLATEMVGALVAHAAASPGVTTIVAQTRPGNRGSVRVLERVGFQPAGPGREPGTVSYVRRPA